MTDTQQLLGGIREESCVYYAKPENVKRKWLKQYGRMSLEGDYQINKSCIQEVFNMLDVVAENKINDFLINGERLPTRGENTPNPKWGVRKNDQEYWFLEPTNFHRRVKALKRFGYDISEEIDTSTREVRNDTAHGNKTITQQHIALDYESTRDIMLEMADALIALGILSIEDRIPSFEKLRVREGCELREGEYVIGQLIGEGGMSRVYASMHRRLGRRLAIKELIPGTYSEGTVAKECSVLLWLRHECIPHIYDTFFENGTYYIVMEYIEGQVLDVYCALRMPDDKEKLRIAIDICEVLRYLHGSGKGIVYADLKPQNILIDWEGKPHLVDFGISRHILETDVRGWTSDYAAPEVLSGIPGDFRSDIYSFGKLLEFLFPVSMQQEKLRGEIQCIAIVCTKENLLQRAASIEDVLEGLNKVSDRYGQSVMNEKWRQKGKRRKVPGGKRYFIPIAFVLILFEVGLLTGVVISKNLISNPSIADRKATSPEEGIDSITPASEEAAGGITLSSLTYRSVNEGKGIRLTAKIFNGTEEKITGVTLILSLAVKFGNGEIRIIKGVEKKISSIKKRSSEDVIISLRFKDESDDLFVNGIEWVNWFEKDITIDEKDK